MKQTTFQSQEKNFVSYIIKTILNNNKYDLISYLVSTFPVLIFLSFHRSQKDPIQLLNQGTQNYKICNNVPWEHKFVHPLMSKFCIYHLTCSLPKLRDAILRVLVWLVNVQKKKNMEYITGTRRIF